MRLIHPLLWGLIITLFSLPTFADWEVGLRQRDTSVSEIHVNNDVERPQVVVYLVWVDLDAPQDADERFLSWRFDERERGWKSGLKPVLDAAINLPVLDSYTIEFENKSCPEQHRCFLALVAIPAGQNPLNTGSWQAASLLPLSLSASQARLPGQQFFLPRGDSGANYLLADEAADGAMPTTASKVEAAPEDTSGAGAPVTEKPDIFRLVDNKLLYANGQAKRFQVIDVADLSNPRLSGWTALSGNPRELYVLGDYYVLLQTDYVGEDGTHLTVLRQGADGTLTTVQDMTLSGHFIESRRRNDVIYTVTQESVPIEQAEKLECVWCINRSVINIKALRFDAGQLAEIDKTSLPGYSPTIAIFSDHLVMANHNPEEEKWQTTQIQVIDLSQTDPLVELPILKVPGQVPSEFHLSVKDQQLRVVYGPENREAGSTLAIYNLASPEMALVGKVDKIAPGEALFATRFVEDRAFVVTFERTDPLWVIGLSNPAQPEILGELHVPGWSEKMFFHEDRLFAVGYDDQPLENEESRWVRRVALSLFNVADPNNPTLINRLTPFAGEVSSTWSPAIDDERALLLNWSEAFAALPINSWETSAGSHLQIVSLANDKVEDAGRLDSSVEIQRSVSLASDVLAALGDQALQTLRWGNGKPERLGELELATNLSWLELQGEHLWAAATGNKGYHRFYRYTTENVETPAKRWSLPRGYNGLEMDNDWAVFYDTYPSLAVQVLDVKTGELRPALVLEKEANETSEASAVDTVIAPDIRYYSRSQPMVHDGWFYLAEQRPFKPTVREQTAHLLVPEPEQEYWQPAEWLLRSWNLKVEKPTEAPTRSIPGSPVALTPNGELITQESNEDGQLRLNLLALQDAGNAKLLHSHTLRCRSYSQVMWADEALYVKCETADRYWYGPVYLEEPMAEVAEDKAGDSQTDESQADESPGDETDKPVEPIPTEPPIEPEPVEPTTQLLRLKVEQGFVDDGSWSLAGYQNLRAVSKEIVLVASNGWYGFRDDVIAEPMVAAAPADVAIMPHYQSGCDIYQLVPEQEPKLLKHLETCSYTQEGMALTPTQAWMAEGFAGIKEINW
jgi:hypothetical protein